MCQPLSVNLSRTKISDYVFDSLGRMKNLKELFLSGCDFLTSSVFCHDHIFKIPYHRVLLIADGVLGLMKKARSLEVLNLKGTKMNSTISNIFASSPCCNLVSLNLSHCRSLGSFRLCCLESMSLFYLETLFFSALNSFVVGSRLGCVENLTLSSIDKLQSVSSHQCSPVSIIMRRHA